MIFLLFSLLLPSSARAQDAATTQDTAPVISTDSVLPTYLALEPNINDYNLFADGGPDSNWYVGFNNTWIIKLPPAPAGQFARAFIGAKLGRAKTTPDADAPWRRDVVDGKIYMAISPVPEFSPEQSYFLAQTEDLPREADPQTNVAGVGASRWFWAEVPPNQISANSPNYLIIWSPTPGLDASSDSPILAASNHTSAYCSDGCAWNNNSIQGAPPSQAANALETPLSNLLPAMAIELVPAPAEPLRKLKVSDVSIESQDSGLLVRFSVSGKDISQAWVETSQDEFDWQRMGPFLQSPPFFLTLDSAALKHGQYLRAAARDIYGDEGYSAIYAAP